MKKDQLIVLIGLFSILVIVVTFTAVSGNEKYLYNSINPQVVMIVTRKTYYNSFVDCNMTKALIGTYIFF